MSAPLQPILHHYPASPFAEKIRLLLGFKKLAWKSVIIPYMMPKPDVVALTGGYRRTPLLQLGADVYCDSALISRIIERIAPSPTLYPFGDTLAAQALAHFGDHVLFNITVPLAMSDAESFRIFFPDADAETMQRFREDRAAMRQGGTVRRGTPAECRAAYRHFTPRLEKQFSDARPFLFGDAPCVADFALYHAYWPITRVPKLAGLLREYPALSAWMERMRAIGHGSPSEISSAEALEEARASRPAPLGPAEAFETEGVALGESVEVLPVDYALDPVRGELLDCSAGEIAVRRSDARAGTVVVHFPRFGYQLRKAGD
jgi:glutathione S-transferase